MNIDHEKLVQQIIRDDLAVGHNNHAVESDVVQFVKIICDVKAQ